MLKVASYIDQNFEGKKGRSRKQSDHLKRTTIEVSIEGLGLDGLGGAVPGNWRD